MLCHRASHLLTPLLQRSSSIVTSTTLCSCLATSPPRRYLKFKSRSDPTKDPNYQATREKKLAQAQLAADREKIAQATIQKIIHSRAPRIKNWKRQEIKYDEQGFPLPTPLPFTEAPIDFDTDLDHMKQRRTEERERSSLRRRILADKGIRRDTMKFINQVLAEKTERLGYDPVQLEYNRMKEKQITTEDEIRGIFNKESDMDLAKLIALDTHDVGRMRRLARARRLEVRNEKQKARDERDTVIAYEYTNGTDAAKAFKLTMEKFDKLGKKVFDWWPQTGGTRKQMKATGFMDIRAIILHWKDMEKMAHHLNRKFIYREKHESDLKSFGEPDMQPKIPVISILGHKDHGKTTLLDQFRGTNVAATEEGQMTQQTYCYQVKLHESSNLTFPCSFIDTPGHANFADMRANGAFFADLVLLVVAADEGVLKQTEESLSYAKQFDVPVVVVINKIDVENANVARVRQQLIDTGVTIVDNKSDTLPPKGSVHVVEISALNRTNLDELITVIFKLQNQLNKQCDLNAIPRGEMLEGFREEGGRNNVLRIILRQGTLRLGQYFVCGFGCGKVLSIKNQYGERVDKAYPGVAVEVHKINILPNPGNDFFVCSEEGARRVVAARLAELHYHDQPRFTQSQQDAQLTRELEYQQQLYHELKRSIKQKEAEKKQAEYDNEKQWQEYMRQENIKKAKIERGEDVEEDENEEMDEEEEDEMEEQDIKANETDTKPKLTASARRAAKRARARERAAMGPIYPVIDYTKPRNIVIKTDSIGSLRMFEESINALNLALKKEMITVAYSHAGRVSNFDLQQAILGEADHIYVFRLPAASKEIQQSAREKGITIKPFRLFEQLLQDIHPAFDPAIFEFVHPHIDQHHDVMKEIQPPTPQEKYHKMKQEIEEMKQRQRQKQEDEDEDDEFEHEDEVEDEDEDEMEDMESEPAPRQRRGSFFANHTTTRDAHVISSTTHTPESPSESPTQRVSTSRRRF